MSIESEETFQEQLAEQADLMTMGRQLTLSTLRGLVVCWRKEANRLSNFLASPQANDSVANVQIGGRILALDQAANDLEHALSEMSRPARIEPTALHLEVCDG